MTGGWKRIERVLPWIYAAAAVAAVCVYALASARFTGGAPLMPVDDAYIHFQYACQLASGEPFVYNPGQPPTSGGTSLIYPALLAPACGPADHGLGVGIWAAAIGACGLFVAAECVRQLAIRWGRLRIAGALLGLAVIGGAMTWHAASGMETLLVGGLMAAALLTFDRASAVPFAVVAALLAMSRPEAAAFAVLAGIMFAGRAVAQRKWRTAALVFIALLAAAGLQPALNLIVTGGVGSSGGQSKSLFSIIPFDFGYVADRILGNTARLWWQFLTGADVNGHWILPPLTGLAAGVGAVALMFRRNLSGLLMLGWWAAGFAAIATLDTAFWHFNRYSAPLLIVALPAVAAAISRLDKRVATGVAVGVFAFAGWTHITFFDLYRINVENVARQPLAMSRWIATNVSPESVVAVHDVGLTRFIGGRTTLDMVGLTSPDAAESWRNGPGAVGEYLDRQQPDYIAAYTDARGLRYLADALYGPPIVGFDAPVDPITNVALGGPFQGVYRPDWTQVRAEPPLPPALVAHLGQGAPFDIVDVADIESERAHHYSWSNAARPAGFASEYYDLGVMGCHDTCRWRDGGRVLSGAEQFVLDAPDDGDVILLSVYHAPAAVTMTVRVNGGDVVTHNLPGIPGQFVVVPTRIPAQNRGGELRVEIDYSRADQIVTPYWHGVYAAAPLSTASASIHFAQAGVGLEPAVARQGDALAVSLSWLNEGDAVGDFRRFVHVYAQLDQPPVLQDDAYLGGGAFPPGILPPGVTSEQVVLDLAPLPAGRYSVAVGLYAPNDGVRVRPAVTCCWAVDADRVLIGEVVIGDDG